MTYTVSTAALNSTPTNHLFFAVIALLARALVDIFVHIFLPVILWQ